MQIALDLDRQISPSDAQLDVARQVISWQAREPGDYRFRLVAKDPKIGRRFSTETKTIEVTPDPDVPGASRELRGLRAPFTKLQAESAQERWAGYLKTPRITINSIGMRLVVIPPGKFRMGSSGTDFDRGEGDEQPPHDAIITKPFLIGETEVTQAQYFEIIRKNPSSLTSNKRPDLDIADTSNYPVDTVSFDQAEQFCEQLNQLPREAQAGRRYRLPTEAEWEYACRAGTTTPYYFGGVENASANTWYRSNSGGHPHPVGQLEANHFGLKDMAGNLWEWCQDYGIDSPGWMYQPLNRKRIDPRNDQPGLHRVHRGGSIHFNLEEWPHRSADRGTDFGTKANYDYGFRVVCEIVPGSAASAISRYSPLLTRRVVKSLVTRRTRYAGH
jgi:formylglycine-generating enzyme required for sulfatase activity